METKNKLKKRVCIYDKWETEDKIAFLILYWVPFGMGALVCLVILDLFGWL